jgi:hydrogenase nickel incorporation protein HypB
MNNLTFGGFIDLRKIVTAKEGIIFDVELEESLLAENRKIASDNRETLKKHKIKTVDVMGSIGSGKTSIIELFVERLKGRKRVAVIEGDLTTTIDSDRIAKHGVEVIQINTGKECHLDANLVKGALEELNLNDLDIIFIENVGNLICPAEFPLGSDKRLVVISVTEGPYMVVKHPFIFMEADVVAINKIDLAEHMNVNVSQLEGDVKKINPKANVVRVSCKKEIGINKVFSALGFA